MTANSKMTPNEFCNWLKGFAELDGSVPSARQWTIIRERLDSVFCNATNSIAPIGFGVNVVTPASATEHSHAE